MPFRASELQLLERLLDAETVAPDEPFVAVWLNQGTVVAHPGMRSEEVNGPALHMLTERGVVFRMSMDHLGRPKQFQLATDARRVLEEETAKTGQPTALEVAQRRIDTLEAQAVTTANHHQAVAVQVGGSVRRAVLGVLVLVIVGLVLWAFWANTLLPGLLAGALVVYAVVTDALGYTAASVAKRAGDAVSRRLMRALDAPPD